MNEEFPVSASHKLALITSLPFVHTARRYYRLDDLVRTSDWPRVGSNLLVAREDVQTVSSRGSKSRNKVSVGEPAEGSLPFLCGEDGKETRWLLTLASGSPGVILSSSPPGPSIGIRFCCTFLPCGIPNVHFFPGEEKKTLEIQLRTMDHSVRRSMKNAANCVKYGELQGSRNRYMSNAYGAFIFMMEARLSEGLLNGIDHLLSRASHTGPAQGSRDSWFLLGCASLWMLFLGTGCVCGLSRGALRGSSSLRPTCKLSNECRSSVHLAFEVCGFQAGGGFFPKEKNSSIFGPQIRRGYPPNLSISFSGGKETKEDSPSNGERTGISPAPNLPSLRRQDLWCAGTPFFWYFPSSQVRWNAALSRRG